MTTVAKRRTRLLSLPASANPKQFRPSLTQQSPLLAPRGENEFKPRPRRQTVFSFASPDIKYGDDDVFTDAMKKLEEINFEEKEEENQRRKKEMQQRTADLKKRHVESAQWRNDLVKKKEDIIKRWLDLGQRKTRMTKTPAPSVSSRLDMLQPRKLKRAMSVQQ